MRTSDVRSWWTQQPRRTGRRLVRQLRWRQDDGDRAASIAVCHYPVESPAQEPAQEAAQEPARQPAEDSAGYQDPGTGHWADRPRLLMVHGFRGDHHGMQLLVDALPDYEIFVPDLPGFGQSPPVHRPDSAEPVIHDLGTYAAAVATLAQQLQRPSDVLIGHSFGSVVAAAATARASAATGSVPWAGLGLIAPLTDPLFTGRSLVSAVGVELYYRLAAALPRRAGDALISSRAALAVTNLTMITTADPQIRSYVRDQHRRHFSDYADRAVLLDAYRASSRHTVLDFADQLNRPVLLLAGARDTMSTPAGRHRLWQTLPDGQLEVLRDVGHLIHYEKPAVAARAVDWFLQDLR